MGLEIAFWVLAVVIVAGALSVVLLKNIFRSALALILCFLGVAGIYITLSADFLAVIQVLVYIGGISVLVLLAIMLTRNIPEGSPANRLRLPALLVAGAILVLLVYSTVNTSFPVSSQPPLTPTTAALGRTLLDRNGFVLPLEIAGLLLLAAILGAIVMAKEK
jgi:NADH-quinone oxidoreductase subunit J